MMRCLGEAPDHLVFELGVRAGRPHGPALLERAAPGGSGACRLITPRSAWPQTGHARSKLEPTRGVPEAAAAGACPALPSLRTATV
jgi:hypothetical protein